jgi:RecA-family ATPase
MKSWTALKIAYDVQNGNKFLGHDVEQGDVLYFALEDSQRRIKDRVLKLGYERKKHPQILLANDVPYLKYGFETCITNWIESKQNPRLIIIDTLARIKPRVARNSGTAYDQDNELLSGIQKIAIQNNITVAFITHLSKASTDYSFDKIQGSVGIQGMTDAMWLIDRGDNTNNASIVGRGRDINDFEYAVKWNADTWCYDFTGNLEIVQKTENRLEVINAMKELSVKQKEIAPRDICKHYGFTSNSKDGKRISKTMQRMLGDSELIKGNKYGTYIYMEPSSNY